MRPIRFQLWAELQNIPNWQTVVQALPPQGCLPVTRVANQQTNPEINRLAQLLTEQDAQASVVSVDVEAPHLTELYRSGSDFWTLCSGCFCHTFVS